MNKTTKAPCNGQMHIVASIAIAVLLAVLVSFSGVAASAKTGTASIVALKANGSGETSMMASALGSLATLEESDGNVYAVLTFQDAKIMGIKADCTKITNIKSYSGETAHPGEDISKESGAYCVRVYIPDINADTVLKLTPPVIGIEQTVLLHLTNIHWNSVEEAESATAATTILSTTAALVESTVETTEAAAATTAETPTLPVSAETHPVQEAEGVSPAWVICGIAALGVLMVAGRFWLRKRTMK